MTNEQFQEMTMLLLRAQRLDRTSSGRRAPTGTARRLLQIGIIGTLTACSGGTEVSCTVTSVSVNPNITDVFVGSTVQLAANLAHTNCNPTPPTSWSSSATEVATVSSSGLVSGVTEGTATITASAGGQSGSAAITVRRVPVASVAVTAPSASVAVGSSIQAVADARSASGASLAGRAFTWQSSDVNRATVSNAGLITGVSAGAVTITATSEGQSGNLAIIVVGAPTLSVSSVTPSAGATDVSIESTVRIQFSASVNVSTVTPQTIIVTRVGAGAVPGTFNVNGSLVTFTPTAPLTEFGSSHTVTVTTGVLSTVGNFLSTQFNSTFTTAFWDPNYHYRITNEARAGTSLDTFSDTFGCFMGPTGGFTGQFWYFVPISAAPGFYYMKNRFQGDVKALEGADNPQRCFIGGLAPQGFYYTGQAWRAVPYGNPYPTGFRLQNENLGAAKSLDTPIVAGAPYPSMQPTANSTSQVWYFARIGRR